jgi:hypothetical protein
MFVSQNLRYELCSMDDEIKRNETELTYLRPKVLRGTLTETEGYQFQFLVKVQSELKLNFLMLFHSLNPLQKVLIKRHLKKHNH